MSEIQNISRRAFIKNMGLASGGLILACNYTLFSQDTESGTVTEFNPNLFVQLNSDGSLIIIAARSEMGNGVRTSLTSVVADEMEADWNRVSVKQATGDAKYGDQNTDGSRSVADFYDTMRTMGAMTRMMLITAAAKKWQVPES
jgi:isoquinoline 1-oxidoreductase beta subunit